MSDVDVSKAFRTSTPITIINEADRLRFAKQILFVIALICSAVFIAYAAHPDNTALAQIFEVIKIGALPLITLVISFYFPTSSNNRQ